MNWAYKQLYNQPKLKQLHTVSTPLVTSFSRSKWLHQPGHVDIQGLEVGFNFGMRQNIRQPGRSARFNGTIAGLQRRL